MKTKTNKILSLLLTFCMVMAFMPMFSMKAHADSAATLATKINSFAHGGTGTLAATVSGSTVNVTGTVAGANDGIVLNIDSGVTVNWRANFSGSYQYDLIGLTGSLGKGTFEVGPGGSIINTHTDTGSQAIFASGGSYIININGGTVKATGTAIYAQYDNTIINVSSGSVSSTEHTPIYITGTNCKVNISGGTVSKFGKHYPAIFVHDDATNTTVDISGGFVFGYDPYDDGLISMYNTKTPTISGTGIVCAWVKPTGMPVVYEQGSSTNLTANSGASTKWGIRPADASIPAPQNGIIYVKGSNTGFFPIYDVKINSFNDVKVGNWFYGAVMTVYANDLFSGTGANTFAPNDTMTRAMVAQVLYNYQGAPSVGGLPNPFKDVPAGVWYENAIKWAYSEGVVSGTSANTYSPNDPVTREQLATILWNFVSKPIWGGDLSKFTDGYKTSSWAVDGLTWTNEAGLIAGYPDKTVRPQGKATRAEVAAVMSNFMMLPK